MSQIVEIGIHASDMFINYKNKLKNKLMNNTYNIIYIV
jgi:hypothetical protein